MKKDIDQTLEQAKIKHSEGKFLEAEKLYRFVLVNQPSNLIANINVAQIFYQHNKFVEAEIHFKKSIEIQPDLAEAHCNLGDTLKMLGKLYEAETSYKKALELKPVSDIYQNLANTQIQLKKFEEAEINYKKVLEFNPDNLNIQFNLGNTLKDLNKLEEAELSYKKAIELKPDYAEAHNALGNTLKDMYRYEDAEVSYKKAIKLKKDFNDARCNLGILYKEQNKNEHAIEEFTQILDLDPKHSLAKVNLINLLDSYLPTNKNTHPIIIANNNLKKIKNTFSLENGIKKNDLANLIKESNMIIKDKIGHHRIPNTQIYRKNSISLGCDRHMKIFYKYNIIPKFCFSCFKIQIEPKNVFELFKLYFIFDKLQLTLNNVRKCMIELRPKVSGTYKGLIYCSSMEEANEILKEINPIINRLIICKIKIKRGCSEYLDFFSDYKVTNKENINFMNYKESWKKKEEVFDSTYTKHNIKKLDNLSSLSISDILTMNKWLNYAKIIDDSSYKDISQEILYSNEIYKKMSEQVDIRKKEFSIIV